MSEIKKEVYHVVSARGAKGARIYAQSYYAESHVFYADVFHLPLALFRALIRENRRRVIFHEQYSLASLLISYVLKVLFRKKHVLVYDMHDIVQLGSYTKLRTKVLVSLYRTLEYIALRILKIPVITVSQYLSSYISREYKAVAPVVYSVPPSLLAHNASYDEAPPGKRRVLYFGLIEPTRLDASLLEEIVNRGFQVDLYGMFSSNGDAKYKESIIELINESGGKFRGKYSPSDLNFIKDYAGVLMLYDTSSENVKGCLPNKLFQSMVMKKPCVVSPDMVEARDLFQEYNAVVTDVELLFKGDRAEWDEVNKKIVTLRDKSELNFKTVMRMI